MLGEVELGVEVLARWETLRPRPEDPATEAT